MSDDLAARVRPETLKEMTERLKQRTGKIIDVQGQEGWIEGDRAEASAALKTELIGEPLLKFILARK